MAEAARKKKLGLWPRIAIGAAAVVLFLAAVGISLRYWITSDAGRSFIVSQIDGRRIGPLGVIRLSGLTGDPLKAATLTDIALVDDDGIWLRARDAKIDWSPFKLLGGQLEIVAVDVRVVDVLRRPRTTYESQDRPPPDIDIRLDELAIQDFRIADGVFGAAASYKIGGGVARNREGDGFLRIGVQPLTGPGDRLQASAEWSVEDELSGEAEAFGPAGGALAGLLQAPEGQSVTLDASLSGTVAKFSGALKLMMADHAVASIDVKRDNGAANLNATIDVENWPLMAPVALRTGGPLVLAGEAKLADPAKGEAKLIATAPTGRLEISGPVNFEAVSVGQPLRVRASMVDLSRITAQLKGQLDADGTATVNGLLDWAWQGNAAVAGLSFPNGEARRVAGDVVVRQQGSVIAWQATDALAQAARITSVDRMQAADYRVDTRGSVNLMSRIVEVSQAQVRGAPGTATGRGQYNILTGGMEFAGAASLERLADFSPLTGSARGQWTVKRSSQTAPIRISTDATGRNVASGNEILNQILGASPRILVSAVSHRGHVLIESGELESPVLAATMSGRIEDSGTIRGLAQGRLKRPLQLGAARLSELGFNAEVSGATDSPRVSLAVHDGDLTAGGVSFTRLNGTVLARLGDRISGDVNVSGLADGQEMWARGRLDGGDGAWRLVNVTGKIGALDLASQRLAFEDGAFSADVKASGSLAGLYGVSAGTLTLTGDFAASDGDLDLQLNGQAANIVRGGLRVKLLAFEGEASGDRATLSGRVEGDLGAPMKLAYSADARRDGEGWAGQANFSGDVDGQAVATPQPVNWSWSPDGWTTDGRLNALGGRIDLAASDGATGATSTLTIEEVDLRALSRLARINPIAGRVSGRSTFSNTAAGATADLSFRIADATPVGVSGAPATLQLNAQLRNGALTAIATGEGQGLQLNAQGQAPFDVGDGFDVVLATDRSMAATVSLKGRAEQLWAVFGPEGHSLRGAVDADLRVGGTAASPTVDGSFAVAQGIYEQADTGVRLQDIAARGQFNSRSAQVATFTANDGFGGRISGDGLIDWDDGLDGKLEFTANELRALGRDDRFAVVSGSGAVEMGAEAIRISGDMTVEQARFSIEQPAAASIPVLPVVRRVNFPNQTEATTTENNSAGRSVVLDIDFNAPRRAVVFGRGLDSEWAGDIHVGGSFAAPLLRGQARLVRGDLNLAGRRFALSTGTIRFDGPVSATRFDIAAERDADDVDARVRVTGSPDDLDFKLESTPMLPQDEILARVLFGRSASQLSAFEAAQLAGGLAQLAGGTAAFDPAGLVRRAVGLDRVAIGGEGGATSVSAGKYIADDVYVQVGAGGQGGVGAEVEWEPTDNVSIISSAQGNGDTKIAVRWKKDY